jgi:prepilin-type N-terminal cleavage/methylation domain-containing protein
VHKENGFTLIEMLVSLVLLGVVLLVTSGLVLPLQLTRTASNETTGAAVAQSYLELVKNKWLNENSYTNMVLPVTCLKSDITTVGCDIRVDSGWTLNIKPTVSSAWTSVQTLRSVVVEVTMPDGKIIPFSTLVARP